MKSKAQKDRNDLQYGFTMMELVIVMIAFGIIGLLSIAILRTAGDVYWEMTNREAVVQTNRKVLSRMAREISLQLDLNHLEYASEKQLQLVTPRLDTLTYSMIDNELNLSKNHGEARVLSDFLVLGQSSFAYSDSSGDSLTAFPLSSDDLQRVWSIDVQIETALEGDTLLLSSTVFTENLWYGERMPYHE